MQYKDTIVQVYHTLYLKDIDHDNSQIITNVITILIALVAALIALIQVKSNVISSARIIWITNLRKVISLYCVKVSSSALMISNYQYDVKNKKGKTLEEIVDKHYPNLVESINNSNILSHKISLYLNSNEEKHQQLLNIVGAINAQLHYEKWTQLDREKINLQVDEIIYISKFILKEEWEKSKKLFKL